MHSLLSQPQHSLSFARSLQYLESLLKGHEIKGLLMGSFVNHIKEWLVRRLLWLFHFFSSRQHLFLRQPFILMWGSQDRMMWHHCTWTTLTTPAKVKSFVDLNNLKLLLKWKSRIQDPKVTECFLCWFCTNGNRHHLPFQWWV